MKAFSDGSLTGGRLLLLQGLLWSAEKGVRLSYGDSVPNTH